MFQEAGEIKVNQITRDDISLPSIQISVLNQIIEGIDFAGGLDDQMHAYISRR